MTPGHNAMRRKRPAPRPTTAVLMLALAASASVSASATSPWTEGSSAIPRVEPPRGQLRATPGSSRWLTYACGTKNKNGRRGLVERMLTQPCKSSPHKYSANDLYEKNSSKESGGFLIVTGGIIAGILALLGILYLLDRETFTQLTGVTCGPSCKPRCSCRKPRIDEEEDEPTPYERDAYITQDTRMYLDDKHDQEVERPKRLLKKVLRCCFGTKDYEGDKYKVPWTGSEDEQESGGCHGIAARGCSENVNVLRVLWDEFRLRVFWQPTKEYSGDKYAMEEEGGGEEIQMAMSSYEEAEPGTTPW